MKIAHKNPNSDSVQTVQQHSLSAAETAGTFAIPELKKTVYNMTLLHDIGKYQPSFQKKITGDSRKRVDHSTCGAVEAKKLFGNSMVSMISQYCIAGHHTGLPDGGSRNDTVEDTTLQGRLSDTSRLEDYSDYKDELQPEQISDKELFCLFTGAESQEDVIERFAFLTRYCFSCLTDADSLDTIQFCTGRENAELTSDFIACLAKINEKLSSFHPVTALQMARPVLQRQVFEKTDTDSDIYLMNMPTGSGKTLCSMKFALERAVRTGKRRIIYVIPFNSIIDQTVSVLEELFGKSASIVRHQSSFCIDDTDYDEDYKTLVRSVTENWNAQIIVTTSVQFFESVYKNKRNRLRKLHNMADSVIILDEAHMMPPEYLKPCLRAVSYITKLLHSEAVFLTATMPDFRELVRKYALPSSRVTDLITDMDSFPLFRKGRFVNRGEMNEEALLIEACQNPSALIVVNRRATAARLYDMASGTKFHLSTYMSAYDRKRTIDSIRKALADLENDFPDGKNIPEERRILVISTSLIEAGVDLDFFTVYRELSGLDSILQAGGRCNREGRRHGAVIHIFDSGVPSKDGRVNIAKGLLKEYEDISAPECIREYYRRLFRVQEKVISGNTIAVGCTGMDNVAFATYAQTFNLIEGNTIAVAVASDEESRQLTEQLRITGCTNYRKLQKYTFTVYEYELQKLIQQGAVTEYGGVWCLTNSDYYSREKGVGFEATDYYI